MEPLEKVVLHMTRPRRQVDPHALRARFEAASGIDAEVMELERLAAGMRHPALLLHDPLDPEVHWSESAALAEAWNGALLEAVSGVGHRRIVQDSAVIGRIVQLLGGTARRPDDI